MLYSFVKLSLWTHTANVLISLITNVYPEFICWVFVVCSIGIFYLGYVTPTGDEYPIPEAVYYFLMPTFCVAKPKEPEHFSQFILILQITVIMIKIMQYYRLSVLIPQAQQQKARLSNCPGH